MNEPSVASNSGAILETWNWYAGYSTDGGSSFTYLNPFTAFPTADGGFCCDQLAYYEPSRDLYIWVLQYCPTTSCTSITGSNRIRVAVANGAADLGSATWHYWDLATADVGAAGTWYDQPKIGSSANYVYLESSRYTSSFQGSEILRLPLDTLKIKTPGTTLSYDYYHVPTVFSPAPVQRAGTTMYFGTHVNYTTFRLFSWPESVGHAGVTTNDIPNSNYPHTRPYSCPKAGQPYATSSSATPSDWCPRGSTTGGFAHDDRVNSGWVQNGVIGFSWDGGQGAAAGGVLPAFTYPYVHVLRIDEVAKTRIDEPIIFSPTYAVQWSSIAPNANGDLGGVVQWGGNLDHENCGAVVHDGFVASPNFWELHNVDTSSNDTDTPKSGDYTTTRANGNGWSAACYALAGGSGTGYVHPHYLSFSRAGTPPPPVTQYALSVTKSGDGSGTVASSPAGIDCGATCSAAFNAGTAVTLTAANPGSAFAGWSGAGCSGTSACTVTMSASQTVNAQFNKVGTPPTILSAIVGPGRTIKLTKGGRKVASVLHGKFKIVVQDKTKKDNFHLTCSGVNKKTKVKTKSRTTWNVTLTKGKCTYKSDAHKKLKGSFKVT